MKKLIYSILSVVIISALITFSQCGRDQEMTLIIYVKMMDDTMTVVPNARINLKKGDIDVVGYSNSIGRYQYTFKSPVGVDVFAEKDTVIGSIPVTMQGSTVVKLGEPGETYVKSVFIH